MAKNNELNALELGGLAVLLAGAGYAAWRFWPKPALGSADNASAGPSDATDTQPITTGTPLFRKPDGTVVTSSQVDQIASWDQLGQGLAADGTVIVPVGSVPLDMNGNASGEPVGAGLSQGDFWDPSQDGGDA